MRIGFVKYLQNKELSPMSCIWDTTQSVLQCNMQIIENLSGFKIKTLERLNPKTKTKVIDILQSHLRVEREKALKGSHQYNSNRHISLLQALAELSPKKTQP